MSHFVTHVFIPAEVPEDGIMDYLVEVLAPYDENKEVDPYVNEYVKDEEVESLREKYYADRDDIHSDEELLHDWHGGTIKRNEERGEWEVYSTYNPDSKWDWWVIGGRWDGFFNGENIVLATDTTISGKQEEARHDAEREYDKFEKATEGLTFKPWSVFEKDLGHHASEDALSQVREEYHAQKWVQAAKGVAGFIWTPPETHFKVDKGGREAFVRERTLQAGVPYSFIDLGGNWCARGSMGWFGMSSDDKDQEDWSETYINYLHSVPEGTRVVSLDLHI